jgi:hypothetical protein
MAGSFVHDMFYIKLRRLGESIRIEGHHVSAEAIQLPQAKTGLLRRTGCSQWRKTKWNQRDLR